MLQRQATLSEEQVEELESLQEEAEALRKMLPQIAMVHRQVEDKLGAAEAVRHRHNRHTLMMASHSVNSIGLGQCRVLLPFCWL